MPSGDPCTRTFRLLTDDRVQVTYSCGAVVVERSDAVDLELLEDRATYWTHTCPVRPPE